MKRFYALGAILLALVLTFSGCWFSDEPEPTDGTDYSSTLTTTREPNTPAPTSTAPPPTSPPEAINISLSPKTDEELVRSGAEFALRLLWDALPITEDEERVVISTWKFRTKKQVDNAWCALFSESAQKALTNQNDPPYWPMNITSYKDAQIPQQLIWNSYSFEDNGEIMGMDKYTTRHDFSKLSVKEYDANRWIAAVPYANWADNELPQAQDLYLLTIDGGKLDSIRWIGNRKTKEGFPTKTELAGLLPADDAIYNTLRLALAWLFPFFPYNSDDLWSNPADPDAARFYKIDSTLGLKTLDDLKKQLDMRLTPNMYELDEACYKTIDGALYRQTPSTGYSWYEWRCVALWKLNSVNGVDTYRFDSTIRGEGCAETHSYTITFNGGKLASMEEIDKYAD
ncbi:MAG: hypothetical protein LBT21_02820 [Oscillospiraceae bacterium]|jgi:hypothetical protein|nr:hypothetical protein [Oscillospiraceae bacterium]